MTYIKIQPLAGSPVSLSPTQVTQMKDDLGITALESAVSSIVTVADNVSVAEDTVLTGNVLTNDSTTTGTLVLQQFTVAGVTGIFQPGNTASITGIGSIVMAANGAYTFTPAANYHGAVPGITYQVNNGADVKLGTLVITVTPVADAPVAIDNTASGPVNGVVTLNPLTNDVSIDGGTLSVTQVNGTGITSGGAAVAVTNGLVSLLSGNVLSIVPANNYVGLIQFTYRCTDSNGLHSTATVRATIVNPEEGATGDYYISPNGSNTNDGLTAATPWLTFAWAYSQGGGGKTYVLMDGTYTDAVTGVINWDNDGFYSARTAQAPGGSVSARTIIVARNRGRARIEGPLLVGRSFRKDSYITFNGIRFEGGASGFNTSFCEFKNCGFHGPFGIGTIDHTNGNTDNLVEDCWVWASGERAIVTNYRADRTVLRRLVARGDGCGTNACAGSGNPNIGFTVYDSKDVSVQNCMVIDRILSPTDTPYGNFASAQHGGPVYAFGRNAWLGCISHGAPDSGYYFECDEILGPGITTWKIENSVAINPASTGFNLSATLGVVDVSNCMALMASVAGDGFRVAPLSMTGAVRNTIVRRGARGFNSEVLPSYVDTFGSTQLYNQTTPTVGVHETDPLADGTPPSIKYPVRVEAGSLLKGAGQGGADIGPTILKRYGVDGAIYGDANYNTLSNVDLWPWPNEDLIKSQMSEVSTRGFCAGGLRLDGINPITLTSYIWESLGYAIPEGVYPATSAPVNTTAPVINGVFVRGGTLTITNGSWANAPTSFAYQWTRNGSPIVGATASTYVPVEADVGQSVAGRVVATNTVGSSAPAAANSSTVVQATAPAVGTAPTITGTNQIGGVSDASNGSFSGSPAPARTYQWALGGTPISGATSATYTNAATGSLTCAVTATNVAGSVSVTTAAVTVTAGTAPAFTSNPVASPSSGVVGTVFTVTNGTVTGSPAPTYGYQWKLDGANVGTNSNSYTSTATGSLTCVVTATNSAGSANATSAAVTVNAIQSLVQETFGGTVGVAITTRAADTGQTWSRVGDGSTDIVIGTGNVGNSSGDDVFTAQISSQVPATTSQLIGLGLGINNTGKNQIGVGGRIAADGSSGYFAMCFGTDYYLYVRSGSSNTILDGPWAGASGRLEIDITDAAKNVLVDGVVRLTSNNNAVTAAGRFAIITLHSDPAGAGGASVDNFEAYAR